MFSLESSIMIRLLFMFSLEFLVVYKSFLDF